MSGTTTGQAVCEIHGEALPDCAQCEEDRDYDREIRIHVRALLDESAIAAGAIARMGAAMNHLVRLYDIEFTEGSGASDIGHALEEADRQVRFARLVAERRAALLPAEGGDGR